MLSSIWKARLERLPPVGDAYVDPGAASVFATAMEQFKRNEFVEAARTVAPLVESRPENGYPLIFQAGLYAYAERWPEAIECLRLADLRPKTIAYLSGPMSLAPHPTLGVPQQIARRNEAFAETLGDLRLLRRAAVRIALAEPQCLWALLVGATMMRVIVSDEYSRAGRSGPVRGGVAQRLEMHRLWTVPVTQQARKRLRMRWASPWKLAILAGISIGEARAIFRGEPVPPAIGSSVRLVGELAYRGEWHAIRRLVKLVPDLMEV